MESHRNEIQRTSKYSWGDDVLNYFNELIVKTWMSR